MHATASTVYKQEVRLLTANDVGWQFTASRAHATQFSDFQMASVIATVETRAPLLWDLFDHLFCCQDPDEDFPFLAL